MKHSSSPHHAKPSAAKAVLTAVLAAALCAALTMPALTSTHADQPATTNVEGLAARFTDDDLFMVNSAADSSRRMYAVSRNGTSHMQLDGSLPFTQRAECAGRQTEQRKWHGGRARRGTSERPGRRRHAAARSPDAPVRLPLHTECGSGRHLGLRRRGRATRRFGHHHRRDRGAGFYA